MTVTGRPLMKKYRIDFEYDSGEGKAHRVLQGKAFDYGHDADTVLRRKSRELKGKHRNARNFSIHVVG